MPEEVTPIGVKKEELVKPEVTESKLTMETYCTQKGIPARRWAGMKAFTKTVRATVAEWDNIFKAY
jgi:hypothetical protein